MAHKFNIAYIYLSPLDADRMTSFRLVSGDSEKTLVTQYVRGWIARNRDYYLELAREDASVRGMEFSKWGQVVVAKGMKGLPEISNTSTCTPVQEKMSSRNPLATIPNPHDSIRKSLNYIELGTQNIALLRCAIFYDNNSAIDFVSRVVREHLQRNWNNLYESQIRAENFDNWK
jgi:hypothetical protein